MIPITILTGFLGSGKTTLLQKIITQNPEIKFGLIINEFGEVGIDGQVIENSGQEMIEMSNGCLCCIVRKDLNDTVQKLIDSKKVDYIIIETSGLAEPKPIADTFIMDNLNGQVNLDGIVCLIDVDNYQLTEETYKVALEQIQFCDIIIINKVNEQNKAKAQEIKVAVAKINPYASILENGTTEIQTQLLIDSGKWSSARLLDYKIDQEKEGDHSHENHSHHEHEHNQVDEIVFTSQKDQMLDPVKLDDWLQNSFPADCVRAKGILFMKTKGETAESFLFQMVGASKTLVPFKSTASNPNSKANFSKLVLIGKNLNHHKSEILKDINNCLIIL